MSTALAENLALKITMGGLAIKHRVYSFEVIRQKSPDVAALLARDFQIDLEKAMRWHAAAREYLAKLDSASS